MNSLLSQRFKEIEDLFEQRTRLNNGLPLKVGVWTGVGALGAIAIIASGGTALAAVPVMAAIQAARVATKGGITAAQLHRNQQASLDNQIKSKFKQLTHDITQQVSTSAISHSDATAAYYRLKYMDKEFEKELGQLAIRLGLES
jgi:hypothetical protein